MTSIYEPLRKHIHELIYSANLEGKASELVSRCICSCKARSYLNAYNNRWILVKDEHYIINNQANIAVDDYIREFIGFYIEPDKDNNEENKEVIEYQISIDECACPDTYFLKPCKISNPFTPYFMNLSIFHPTLRISFPKKIPSKIITLSLAVSYMNDIKKLKEKLYILPLLFSQVGNLHIAVNGDYYLINKLKSNNQDDEDDSINSLLAFGYQYLSPKFNSRLKKIVSKIESVYLFQKMSRIRNLIQYHFGIYLPNEILDIIISYFPKKKKY